MYMIFTLLLLNFLRFLWNLERV